MRRAGRAAALGLALALGLAACERGGGGVMEPKPRPPETAPDFSLETLEGGPLSLSELRGRPVVIDFWATWCAPCEQQIPVLNAFQKAHGDEVTVLGISVDVGGREVVAPFAEAHDIVYRVLLGDEALARRYGALGFPSLFVVDPQGHVAEAHVGVITREELEEAVAGLREAS